METTTDKLLMGYEDFVKELSEASIKTIGECWASIVYDFDTKEFDVEWNNAPSNRNRVLIYDTAGGNPFEGVSLDQIRAWIIDDANGDLEAVRYDDRF